MKKRRWIVAVATLSGVVWFFPSQGPLAQQGQSNHVTAVRELGHDNSPPLAEIPPLPPQAGQHAVVRVGPTHGPLAPRPKQLDAVLQSSASTPLSTSSGQNFLGLGNGLSGFTVQYIPPDTNGAAGSTQFMQWVNSSFAVFSKSTGSVVYGPAAGNSLWSGFGGLCQSNNSGDPVAQYDKQADRWVMMQPVFKSPYAICVAVSATSDATGSWYRYAFSVPSGQFPDYPKLSVWGDGYYLSYNQFKGNTFVGAAACALDRSNMLIGNAATMQCFSNTVGPSYGALLPADLDGSTMPPSGSPAYFLNYGSDFASLDLWEFQVDWKTPANSTLGTSIGAPNATIPVSSFAEGCGGGACVPQKGVTQPLDSLGDRLMYRLAYRNFGSYESLLANHTVNTGTSAGNTGIRWYELRESSPSTPPASNWGLHQQGTYAPDSNYRWMGSMAQDKAGNIVMGYSVSSSSISPTIRYTGRAPSDPAGQMDSENDILTQAGIAPGSQTSYTRWGDYSSMALDPTDDCTFWYTTEYQPRNGSAWSTRIASFSFPGCTGAVLPTVSSVTLNPSTVVGGNSSTGTVTLSAAAPSGGASVALSSNNSAAQVSASVTVPFGQSSATFTVTTSTVSATSTAKITATYNSSSQSATLMVNPAATGNFSITAANISVPRGSTRSEPVTVSPLSNFNGTVSLSLSGKTPTRTSANLSPTSVTVTPTTAGVATLTVKATKNAVSGSSSTLTITGTSGSLTHTIIITVSVQ